MTEKRRMRRRQFDALAGRQGSVALALEAFAEQFAVAAHRLRPLARSFFRRFFVTTAELHFPEYPFALHFFLQGSEGLINIIVANEDLHGGCSP